MSLCLYFPLFLRGKLSHFPYFYITLGRLSATTLCFLHTSILKIYFLLLGVKLIWKMLS